MARMTAGIGTSEHDDPRTAGGEAARQALERLGAEEPALVLVYSSVRYDLPVLLGAIREVTGEVPLVGASTTGHFAEGRLTAPGRGVAVLVLGAGGYRFGVTSAAGLRADADTVGAVLARQARQAAGPPAAHAAVVVLSCGLTGDQQQLINGLYRVTGAAVPIVGGAASDDRLMRETYVFHDDRVLTDSAVAVWVWSDHPMKVVRGHGWRPMGLPMPVTGVDGTVVRTIAGRPASEVFLETVATGEPAARGRRAAGATRSGGGTLLLGEAGRALGLLEPDGSRRIRGAFMGADGEMNTWVPLPPFAAVQIMACTQDDLLDGCDDIAPAACTGTTPGVVLAFSCAARLGILADRAGEEAERLQTSAGAVPTFGFYTYGEFARTTSVDGVHNATVTALAL